VVVDRAGWLLLRGCVQFRDTFNGGGRLTHHLLALSRAKRKNEKKKNVCSDWNTSVLSPARHLTPTEPARAVGIRRLAEQESAVF
jgi:hypothetical protein